MATKEMIANYMDGKRGLDAASEQADLAGDRRRRAQIDPARSCTHARTNTHAACRRHALRRASLRVRQRDDARGGRARLRARDALGGGDGLGGRVHHARGVADRARARVGLRRDRAGRGTQQRALNGHSTGDSSGDSTVKSVRSAQGSRTTRRCDCCRFVCARNAHTHTRMRACAYIRWQRRRRYVPCAATGSAARCRNASAAAARNLRRPPPHQSAMRRLR